MDFKIEGDLGVGKLSPGVTKRRWEPDKGINKHREKIHKESKHADDYKNLPFTFSKPRKASKVKIVKCSNCGRVTCVSINTVGIVCSGCHLYASVEEVHDYV